MRKKRESTLFEGLEPRQMFASVNYADGIVTITGNPTRTDVHITNDFANMAITGVTQRTTIAKLAHKIDPKRPPQMIRITTFGASEKIIIDPDVTIPVYINSGGGNDTVQGGAGNDTIISGTGNDVIDPGLGKNFVLAGSGNDRVRAHNTDTVWGQAGNDIVTGTVDVSNISPGATTDSIQQQNEFTLGSNTDGQLGFMVSELDVADLDASQNVITSTNRAVATHIVSQTLSGGVLTEVITNDDGSIVITASLKENASLSTISATVTNNSNQRITNLLFSLPRIYANVTSNFATMSGFRGGTEGDWPTATITQQGGGTWPGYCYSPIAAFYDKSTNEGVGMVAFNDRLDTTLCYWYLSASFVQPLSRVTPNLDKGQTATYQMAEVHGQNMPSDVANFYRQMYLQPFMANQGIPEANYQKTGVWGMANFNYAGTLPSTVQEAMSKGASGWVEWSGADFSTPYYEPFDANSPNFPWAGDLPATGQIPGLQGMGVLIDPFESQRINNGDGTFSQVDQSLSDAVVQARVKAQRDQMVKLGVNFAFWDTGDAPRNGSSGQDWINTLWSFKRVGITVAGESSCDINAWITGATVQTAYTFNSFALAKGVTPNATIFQVQNYDQTQVINGQAVKWWDDAQSKGVVPILTLTQLDERAADHALV